MKIPSDLPQIPLIDGLRCEDHATYVANAGQDEKDFISYWAAQGLQQMPAITPDKFPARHIAMMRNPTHHAACEKIVGLSVSDDPESPINKSLRLHGSYHMNSVGLVVPGKLQHIAYEVDPKRSMSDLREELEDRNVMFMTPILRYEDPTGATLEQMFVACEKPFGSFVEVIRRGLGSGGEPFQGFNNSQIDNLYQGYTDWSEFLLRNPEALPQRKYTAMQAANMMSMGYLTGVMGTSGFGTNPPASLYEHFDRAVPKDVQEHLAPKIEAFGKAMNQLIGESSCQKPKKGNK